MAQEGHSWCVPGIDPGYFGTYSIKMVQVELSGGGNILECEENASKNEGSAYEPSWLDVEMWDGRGLSPVFV